MSILHQVNAPIDISLTVLNSTIVRHIEDVCFDITIRQRVNQRRVLLVLNVHQVGKKAFIVGVVDRIVGIVVIKGVEKSLCSGGQGHDVLYIQLSLSSGITLIVGTVTVHIVRGQLGQRQTRQRQKLSQVIVGVKLDTKNKNHDQKYVKCLSYLTIKLNHTLVTAMLHSEALGNVVQVGQEVCSGDVRQRKQGRSANPVIGQRHRVGSNVDTNLSVLRQVGQLHEQLLAKTY